MVADRIPAQESADHGVVVSRAHVVESKRRTIELCPAKLESRVSTRGREYDDVPERFVSVLRIDVDSSVRIGRLVERDEADVSREVRMVVAGLRG